MRFNNSDRHSVRLCVGSIYRRGHTYRHIYRITYLRQMVVPALRQALRPKDMVYEQMSALQSRSRRGQTRISDLFCRGAEKNGLRRFIDPCSLFCSRSCGRTNRFFQQLYRSFHMSSAIFLHRQHRICPLYPAPPRNTDTHSLNACKARKRSRL